MFLAVVSGYIMAAVMAFCGIYSILNFFQGDLQNLGATGFVYGIAVASWPLVVAVALFALVQAVILLEKLVIYTTMNQMAVLHPPTPKASKEQVQRKKTDLPQVLGSFFQVEPSSIPPQEQEKRAPEDMELDSVTELAQRTDNERLFTGSYTAQPAPTAPLAGGDDNAAQEPVPNKRPGDELNFFRID